MKVTLTLFALLVCASLHAMSPEYFSSRKWVERLCSTNTTQKAERLFLGSTRPKKYAAIVDFRKGITLREVIDQTPFKGTTVVVCVLRPKVPPRTHLFRMQPSDSLNFELKNMDMIWLYDDGPLVW